MAFTGACPNLLVTDVDTATPWYRDVLGFRVEKKLPGPPKGVVLERDGVHLLLEETKADLTERPAHCIDPFGVDALFYVDDPIALHEELRTKDVEMLHGDADLPANATTFGIGTPERYIIVFAKHL